MRRRRSPIAVVVSERLARRDRSQPRSRRNSAASAQIDTLQREVREWEPREALDGGASGLDLYARLIPEAARLLKLNGTLVLEIGAGQGETVPGLFDAAWREPSVINDLAGLARVVVAQRA